MKKTTNKVLKLACAVLSAALMACQGSNDEEQSAKTEAEILQSVNFVHAIGKVSPAEDWVVISSPIAARIQQLLVDEGDSVKMGQLLMRLESGTSSLDVDVARAKLQSLRMDHAATVQDLQKAEVRSEELKQVYHTSKRLFEQNAETREKLDADYSAWQQQEYTVRSLKDKINAQQANEREQQLQIQAAEVSLDDFRITAPKDGIVIDLNAKLGQSVSIAEELGKIVDVRQPIVEAEVDELFAHEIRIGQQVVLAAVGRADTVAQGVISYVSPILSDKSILYETANEGADRRVRRVKITLHEDDNLAINAKVDCKIQIR